MRHCSPGQGSRRGSKRPGPPRTITDAKVEEVIVKTLELRPPGATRSMAKEVGISQTSVSQIWRAFGLKPHLVEEFKLSPDPQFIDKVRDVVGAFLALPVAATAQAFVSSWRARRAATRRARGLPAHAVSR